MRSHSSDGQVEPQAGKRSHDEQQSEGRWPEQGKMLNLIGTVVL